MRNKLIALMEVQCILKNAMDILDRYFDEPNEISNIHLKLREIYYDDIEDVKNHILAFEDDDEYDDSNVDDWHDARLLRKYGEQL